MFEVTNGCLGSISAAVSHLDEHGAGLGGDGRQLLQEALRKAQVLFQTLVLCGQTQNPLL